MLRKSLKVLGVGAAAVGATMLGVSIYLQRDRKSWGESGRGKKDEDDRHHLEASLYRFMGKYGLSSVTADCARWDTTQDAVLSDILKGNGEKGLLGERWVPRDSLHEFGDIVDVDGVEVGRVKAEESIGFVSDGVAFESLLQWDDSLKTLQPWVRAFVGNEGLSATTGSYLSSAYVHPPELWESEGVKEDDLLYIALLGAIRCPSLGVMYLNSERSTSRMLKLLEDSRVREALLRDLREGGVSGTSAPIEALFKESLATQLRRWSPLFSRADEVESAFESGDWSLERLWPSLRIVLNAPSSLQRTTPHQYVATTPILFHNTTLFGINIAPFSQTKPHSSTFYRRAILDALRIDACRANNDPNLTQVAYRVGPYKDTGTDEVDDNPRPDDLQLVKDEFPRLVNELLCDDGLTPSQSSTPAFVLLPSAAVYEFESISTSETILPENATLGETYHLVLTTRSGLRRARVPTKFRVIGRHRGLAPVVQPIPGDNGDDE